MLLVEVEVLQIEMGLNPHHSCQIGQRLKEPARHIWNKFLLVRYVLVQPTPLHIKHSFQYKMNYRRHMGVTHGPQKTLLAMSQRELSRKGLVLK